MSFLLNGTDISSNFYKSTAATNAKVHIEETGFRIGTVDICNNFIALGTNSKIPVSKMLSNTYFKNKDGKDISTLFELNLITFTGTINTDYKIWTPASHDGFLIQILTSNAQMTFNYNATCSFAMIGGGGGGGAGFDANDTNSGGGGGAGGLVTGNMNISKNNTLTFTIGVGGTGGKGNKDGVYGSYGEGNGINNNKSGNKGLHSKITIDNSTTNYILAYGGGGGGSGKGSTQDLSGSSTGGAGAYSNNPPTVGSVSTTYTPVPGTSFTNVITFVNKGGNGQDNNYDQGAGGGGGGAGGQGEQGGQTNTNSGNGGIGKDITYGSTNFKIGGGGGGGCEASVSNDYGKGGEGGGGDGGNGYTGDGKTRQEGKNGTTNTGGGGGGGMLGYKGGNGGSGTVIIYIISTNVS